MIGDVAGEMVDTDGYVALFRFEVVCPLAE